MVLPKDIREKANIHPGDKLAVVNMERSGKTCCTVLVKVDEFAEKVKQMLPLLVDCVEYKRLLIRLVRLGRLIFLK